MTEQAESGQAQPEYPAPLRGDTLRDLEERLPAVRERLATALQKRDEQTARMHQARAGVENLTKKAHAADATDPDAAARFREERKRKRAAMREAQQAFERYNARCAKYQQELTELERGMKLLNRRRTQTRRKRRAWVRFGLDKPLTVAERRNKRGLVLGPVAVVGLLVCVAGGVRYYATRTAGYIPEAERQGGVSDLAARPAADTALRAMGLAAQEAPAPVRPAPPPTLVGRHAGMFSKLSPVAQPWLDVPAAYDAPEFLSVLTAGDLDGDGRAELVFVDFAGQRLLTYRATAAGYTFGRELETGPWPNDVACADLDGDGRADVVVAHGDGTMRVYLQPAPGEFAARDVGHGGAGAAIAVVDLNGDGVLDIAATGGKATEVFEGRGDGTFLGPWPVHKMPEQARLVVADFNGDGTKDVATVSAYDPAAPPMRNTLHVALLGRDLLPLTSILEQKFEPPLRAMTAIEADPAVGAELLVLQLTKRDARSGNLEHTLYLLRGDGTEPFEQQELGVVASGEALVTADMTGNGHTDVLAGLDVFFHDGHALRRQSSRFGRGYPVGYWREDLTGDAQPDLVAHLRDSKTLLVFPARAQPASATAAVPH